MTDFILASASPRRREILSRLGINFILFPSGADETGVSGSVTDIVKQLSIRKAAYVAKEFSKGIIIGCDTLVSLDGKALGKPNNTETAKQMLKSLSGRAHEVASGICLYNASDDTYICEAVVSKVYFRNLTDCEIEEYVNTGEPMDKAGAYAIQGGAAAFVEKIEGSYDNIVGFPTEKFLELIGRK